MNSPVISFEEAIKIVRQLAKSSYWQGMYNKAKELHIDLFKNKREFSKIQLEFLNYLSFYSSIYLDINLGEVTEEVLENDIYEDAYMYYKMKGEKKEKEKKRPMNNKDLPLRMRENKRTQWVFRTPKKVGI